MKNIAILLVLILLASSICGCSFECQHQWEEANCNSPRYCSKCFKKEEAILGHSWEEATCLALKTCTRCAETEGELADHSWEEATCSTPRTCSVCKKTEGEVLEHIWVEANCTAPKTCSGCGITEGEAKGHDWQAATLEAPKTCKDCAATEGEPQKSTGDEVDAEFYKKATGYWFLEEQDFFMGISSGKVVMGWVNSEFGPTGKIKSITKTAENTYKTTIYYAAQDNEEMQSPEQTVTYTFEFSAKKMILKEDNIKLVNYGKNFETAIEKYLEKYY